MIPSRWTGCFSTTTSPYKEKQCSTILDLLDDVTGITVYDFVRDIVLSAIIDPVRVKTGPTVVNSKHFIDFFEARVLIESEAAELCALRRSEEDVADLRKIIEKSKAVIDDPALYAQQDYLFHNKISQVSGNIFINKMLECINDFVKEYLVALAHNPAARKRSFANHLKIFKSIREKEAEKAASIIREHLNYTFKKVTGLDPNNRERLINESFNKGLHLKKLEHLSKK